MKLQFEKIAPSSGSSFKVLYTNKPNTGWIYWHFHPEYEIVYIPKGQGRRHVGKHISRYEDGELVFIGPNVPHLNFDYGVVDDFEEFVVQLRADFLGKDFLNQIEFSMIQKLFTNASRGIVFGRETKRKVGERLRDLKNLEGFERLMSLLFVLQEMAVATDVSYLDVEEKFVEVQPKEQERFHKIYKFVEQNFRKEIDYQQIAEEVNMTLPAFCRYFKKMTRMTLTDFVNEFRINYARTLLMQGEPITNIAYEVGFNNLSHFNRTFKKNVGKTPSELSKEMKIAIK